MRVVLLLLALLVVPGWAAGPPKIVLIAGEYEYSSRDTLPVLANELENQFNVKATVLKRPEDPKLETIPGLEALRDADLLILFARRMTLPEKELAQIKAYLDSGKPLVALRTASHAFENWKEFDHEVLGGNYGNHHGNKLKTTISLVPEEKNNVLLRGVTGFVSDGSLYKNTPLQPGTEPLLMGKVEGQPAEPIAWTHQYKGGRVFYTSLGHPNDFKEESFKNLVRNGIEWALGKSLSKKESR